LITQDFEEPPATVTSDVSQVKAARGGLPVWEKKLFSEG